MNDSTNSAHSYYEQQAVVYELLSEAVSHDIDRRTHQREPLMTVVTIQSVGGTGDCLTGFTRDISKDGIGLVHTGPLECENVIVKIFRDHRQPTSLQVRIAWCEPFGEGWYISGGRFIAQL